MESKNKPELKMQVGGVSAAVWLNAGEHGDYRTITLERRYKDKTGEWKSTSSLRDSDLPKAILALTKAYEHCALKSPFPENDPLAGGA